MDPLEEARALLPFWTGGVPLLFGVVSGFSLTWLGIRLGLRHARRLPREVHWTERARALHPARSVFRAGLFLMGMLWLSAWLLTGPLSWAPGALVGACTSLSALCAIVVTRSGWDRQLGRPVSGFFHELRREIATLALLGAPAFVLLAVFGQLRPPTFDRDTVALLAIGAVGVGIALHSGGLLVGGALGLVRTARPRVQQCAADIAARFGQRPPICYEIDLRISNAFAFPFAHRVICTTPLVDRLDDEQLGGILAHEIGHLAERWQHALRVSAILAFVVVLGSLLFTGSGWLQTGALALGFIAAYAFVWRRARSDERRADELATERTDSGAYARALEVVYEAECLPAVIVGGVHPALYDRLLAAGVTPQYPRPLPPSRARSIAACAPLLLVMLASLLVEPAMELTLDTLGVPQGHVARFAWSGGSPNGLLRMALAREGSEEAVVLARAAIASGWLSPYARGYAGSLLARHYRCDEASDVLDGLDASVELDAETDEMVLDARSRIVDCVQAELKHAEELEALEDLEVPEE